MSRDFFLKEEWACQKYNIGGYIYANYDIINIGGYIYAKYDIISSNN